MAAGKRFEGKTAFVTGEAGASEKRLPNSLQRKAPTLQLLM